MPSFTHSIVEVVNGSQYVTFVGVNETGRISAGNGFHMAESDTLYYVDSVSYDGRDTIVKLTAAYVEADDRGAALVYNETDASSGLFIPNSTLGDRFLPFLSGFLRYISGLTSAILTTPILSGYAEEKTTHTVAATGTEEIDCNISKHVVTYTGTGEIKFNLTNAGTDVREIMIRLDTTGATTPSIAWQLDGVDKTPGYLGGAFAVGAEKRRLVAYINDTGADTFEVGYSGVRA